MSNNLSEFEQFAHKRTVYEARKKAIIYTRVSTKEQAETNTSLETQKRHCELYAKKNGFSIAGYFGGTHESAKSDDRKEFKRMIKHAKQNHSIGYIIVYSYDRFSRTGSSASQISGELLELGIQVKAVTQEVDTLSPSGKFQQSLFYMFSQFDNELRRDKTITAMTDLLRKGYWLWTPPRGYTNQNAHKKAVEWKIEINTEGKLLKKAFQWKAKNAYSNADIVRKLNSLGMDIDERRIYEIFKNPFYCGILISKLLPGEVVEGVHPKIVSKEDFIQINSRTSHHPASHSEENANLPLKRFVYCSACNTPLTGFLVKKKGIYYYKCRTKTCKCNKSANQLHETFMDELRTLQIDKDLQGIMRDVMINVYDEMTHELRLKSAQSQKKVTELKKKLNTLEERHALGEIDREIFTKFSENYRNEIKTIQEEIEIPEINSSNLQNAINLAVQMSSKLSDLWDSGNLEQKQQLQKLVFPSGLGYDKQSDKVLTPYLNEFINLTNTLSMNLPQIKNGDSIKNDQISALVTSPGFKPGTS